MIPNFVYWSQIFVLRTTSSKHTGRPVKSNVLLIHMITALAYLEHLMGGKIEKNEMGGRCGAYGRGERRVQGYGGET
jgi:hypothetical protein